MEKEIWGWRDREREMGWGRWKRKMGKKDEEQYVDWKDIWRKRYELRGIGKVQWGIIDSEREMGKGR
jgi:hypothetical protein